jgi:putative acetyltransferase
MILIRAAAIADFRTIAQIFHDSVRKIARQDYTEDELKAWSPGERPPEYWLERTAHLDVRVALVHHILAGFIGFSRMGYIDLLFTRPESVRCGVARTLLSDAETTLRRLGVPVVSTDASLAARGFFLAMGYSVVREQTVDCGGIQLRNCHMNKSLIAEHPNLGGQVR